MHFSTCPQGAFPNHNWEQVNSLKINLLGGKLENPVRNRDHSPKGVHGDIQYFQEVRWPTERDIVRTPGALITSAMQLPFRSSIEREAAFLFQKSLWRTEEDSNPRPPDS